MMIWVKHAETSCGYTDNCEYRVLKLTGDCNINLNKLILFENSQYTSSSSAFLNYMIKVKLQKTVGGV